MNENNTVLLTHAPLSSKSLEPDIFSLESSSHLYTYWINVLFFFEGKGKVYGKKYMSLTLTGALFSKKHVRRFCILKLLVIVIPSFLFQVSLWFLFVFLPVKYFWVFRFVLSTFPSLSSSLLLLRLRSLIFIVVVIANRNKRTQLACMYVLGNYITIFTDIL